MFRPLILGETNYSSLTLVVDIFINRRAIAERLMFAASLEQTGERERERGDLCSVVLSSVIKSRPFILLCSRDKFDEQRSRIIAFLRGIFPEFVVRDIEYRSIDSPPVHREARGRGEGSVALL